MSWFYKITQADGIFLFYYEKPETRTFYPSLSCSADIPVVAQGGTWLVRRRKSGKRIKQTINLPWSLKGRCWIPRDCCLSTRPFHFWGQIIWTATAIAFVMLHLLWSLQHLETSCQKAKQPSSLEPWRYFCKSNENGQNFCRLYIN